jgi:hypothetical protein
MHAPGDITGTYSAIGAGGALAAGAGGLQLQNAKGVLLQLHAVKVGVELSASVDGVEITMERRISRPAILRAFLPTISGGYVSVRLEPEV